MSQISQSFFNLVRGLKLSLNPQRIIKELHQLATPAKSLLTMMLLAQVITFILSNDYSWSGSGIIGLITSVATLINLALVDHGYLTNYFWGLIATAVWFFIAIQNRLIGDMFSQGYYFFMQFCGMAVWFSQLDNQSAASHIKSRKLTLTQKILVTALGCISYAIVLAVSLANHGTLPYLDSALLPLGICGQILMTGGFASQWIIWIILDVINVIIWSIQLTHGGSSAVAMVILQITILLNSFYGLLIWYKRLA